MHPAAAVTFCGDPDYELAGAANADTLMRHRYSIERFLLGNVHG